MQIFHFFSFYFFLSIKFKCAAENEYMDIIAHSTDAGEVVIYASHLAVIECDEKKLKKQRKVRYLNF